MTSGNSSQDENQDAQDLTANVAALVDALADPINENREDIEQPFVNAYRRWKRSQYQNWTRQLSGAL